MIIGDKSKVPSFIFTGDSYASMWGGAIDFYARKLGKAGILTARESCIPFMKLVTNGPSSCAQISEARLQFIENSTISTVILAVRWKDLLLGNDYHLDGTKDSLMQLEVSLDATLKRLHDANKNIFLVYPVLSNGGDPYLQATKSMKINGGPIYLSSRNEYFQGQDMRSLVSAFEKLSKKYPFSVIDPTSILCDPNGCKIADDGKPIYHDGTHLSTYGASLLIESFAPIFQGKR